MNLKLVAGIVLLVAGQAAQAGGSYVGRVKLLQYGTLYIDASATQMSNRPACATRPYVRLQEGQNDVGYKEKFAMLLGAWFAEKPVVLSGTGTCTSDGDEIIYVVSFP